VLNTLWKSVNADEGETRTLLLGRAVADNGQVGIEDVMRTVVEAR